MMNTCAADRSSESEEKQSSRSTRAKDSGRSLQLQFPISLGRWNTWCGGSRQTNQEYRKCDLGQISMPSDTAWFTGANCLPNPLLSPTRYYRESRNASIWLPCTTPTMSRVFWRRGKYSVQTYLRSRSL